MLSVYICSKVITLSGVYCTKPFLLTFLQLPKDDTKQSISTWKRVIEACQKNDWFSWTKYIIFPKKEIVLKQKNILLTSITEELVNATGRRFKHKLIFLSSTKKNCLWSLKEGLKRFKQTRIVKKKILLIRTFKPSNWGFPTTAFEFESRTQTL